MGRKKHLMWQLFTVFARIGAFTFGGGWAMISIIEREIVTNRGWLNREEFLDLLAVAQALPGILAVNIAASLGDRLGGRRGAVAAALGAIMPSFCIILGIAIFLTSRHNREQSCCVVGVQGYPAGSCGLDCGAGTHNGEKRAHRMENRVDSCCCGVTDMVEDSLGVQSYSVYHYRRSGRLYMAGASGEKTLCTSD